MHNNRILYILVGLTLAVVGFFTFFEASSTAAIAQADRSYDRIEQIRSSRLNPNPQADDSYDRIEALRVARMIASEDQSYYQVELLRSQRGAPIADRSYDAIENLRASRGIR